MMCLRFFFFLSGAALVKDKAGVHGEEEGRGGDAAVAAMVAAALLPLKEVELLCCAFLWHMADIPRSFCIQLTLASGNK